ncbi:UDP-N-acetylglucosamine--undecaprenyl-phosphate N-acetylglucosaminephosphotransferase [Flocculibacter collagenilyticus]|uniref:UDP-N-acetylglucosamine--undecaprenyl-phosphate N-acetylglucosaminephosphotransferase n=1 Tax=Flocculibacter collagenilyticus TaxID=2744479 RepID=UPI0018F56CAD|nr:UDP-N-acetylglucosamine--undecaprenyl-phosphate N-acetylglucosaminephosphotransferase [Flocculibacter collagenilyticus]
MLDTLLPLIFTVFATLLSIMVIKPIAVKVGLVDKPNERKKHVGSIPLIGGVAIFFSVLMSVSLFYPLGQSISYYLICAASIVVLGMFDDYRDLSVGLRLMAQALIAIVMISGIGLYISDLGNLFQFGNISIDVFGIPFTILAVIAAINAFNMIDGIDGLAGSLSSVTFVSIAILFFISGHNSMILLPLILVAALLPYLAFNLGLGGKPHRKIFMGDAGSMFIGLSVIWLLIIGTQGENHSFQPVTVLWIIAVPIMDMAAIMFRRIRKGRSPFQADRDHLHHIFLKLGLTSKQALLLITTMSMMLSAIGITFHVLGVSEWFSLLCFMICFIAYAYALQHSWKFVRAVKRIALKAKRQTKGV